jgi:uncharacterized membrane protein (Fun14 family)
MNIVETFGSAAATLGGGFFAGVLIGYALKKVIKMVSVIFGLFLAGLAYLQSQQIANINWNKLQQMSEGTIATIANLTMQIPGISGSSDNNDSATTSLAMTCFGIPFTGNPFHKIACLIQRSYVHRNFKLIRGGWSLLFCLSIY